MLKPDELTPDDLRALIREAAIFIAEECVENYPGERLPGSFADEADKLLKRLNGALP